MLTAAEALIMLEGWKDLIKITSLAYIRSVEETGIEDTSAVKIQRTKNRFLRYPCGNRASGGKLRVWIIYKNTLGATCKERLK